MQMRWLASSLALAAVLLTACSDSTRPRSLSVSVTSKSVGVTASAVSPSGLSADIQVGTGASSLTITSVQLVLAEIELTNGGTCASSGKDDGCEEVELGPLFVDVPMNGTAKPILDASVPAGSYSELEAKLDAVNSGEEGEEGAASFLLAHQDLAGVSVRVVGVFTDGNGMPHDFTFTSNVEAEIEMAFPSPVSVDATTSNLTIDVDVASWFKDASGGVIDPMDVANAEAINANIKKSFKAFEDDDRDGTPDRD